MHICVKSPTGKRIYVKVNPSDTLHTVKTKIHEQYRLVLNGVQLEDNLTLADYDIQHGSTLDLQEKRMTVSVVEELSRRVILVDVDRFDTIGTVKAKIEDADVFPKNRQSLIFAGKQQEDNRTLSDLSIGEESALLLALHPFPRGTLQIFAKMVTNERTLTLEADSLDTIGDVKVKIYQKNGAWPTRQRFLFAGKQLQDNNLTLADCGILNECTIHVVLCLCGC